MKKNIFIFVGLTLALCCCKSNSNSVKALENESYSDSSLCDKLIIKSEIWANEKISDKLLYTKSELWSDYDYDIEGRHIPDFIFIHSKLTVPIPVVTDSLPTDSIYYKTVIQLKYSNGSDCINIVSPKFTEEINVSNGSFTLQDIQNKMLSKNTDSLYYNIITKPIPLKEIMIKYKILKLETEGEKIGSFCNEDGLFFLNQIYVKVLIGYNKSKLNCSYEYIHPICSSIPQTIKIGEQ